MRGIAKLANSPREKKVSQKPIYIRLKEIRERAGISGSQIARDLEYKSPSGYLRYEQPDQGNRPIPYDVVKRLIPLLRGRGDSPVTAEELLLLTDAKDLPKPVQQAFVGIVSDGDGLLAVKYRVERNVYIKIDAARSYGASRIGVSRLYPSDAQWAAAVTEDIDDTKAGTQLHCVAVDQFSETARRGRRVVIGVPISGDIVEVAVARIGTDGVPHGQDGMPVTGQVLGVVVGSYTPE